MSSPVGQQTLEDLHNAYTRIFNETVASLNAANDEALRR
jgi:hypothetical protein